MRAVRSFLLALAVGLAGLVAGTSGAGAGTVLSARNHPGAPVAAESLRPLARAAAGERRCTAEGAHCIALASYIPDVCRTIEALARDNSLDPHFFARLIWRESLFDAGAVSPAGAEGIAQFMPETAKGRGLRDAFNPAEALSESARYLADLARAYGNIGLAAVAYNGGEARATRFIAREGGLPQETIAYVEAITGHSAERWRDAAPAAVDLAISKEAGFQEACIAQAGNRSLREFRTAPPVMPWGVILASHRDREGAERQMARLRNRHAAVLGDESVVYTRGRVAGMRQALYNAQAGRASRGDAEALCARLRAAGGDCMVLRNL